MAAAASRRDLFLQVNGDIGNLERTFKAGKTVVLDFAKSATLSIEQIEGEIRKLGTGGAAGLKDLENNYTQSFKRIRANAQAVLDAPTGKGALAIIDAAGQQAKADDATRIAAAQRQVAEAALAASNAVNGENQALKAFAIAQSAAAIEAEQYAGALRDQAAALSVVQGHLPAQVTAGKQVVATSNAQKFALTSLGQQFTDFTVQVASGQSAVVAFAQQMPQAAYALSGFGGRLGAVGAFLNGPWGIAIQVGLVALTPFVASLLKSGEAADAANGATLSLSEALTTRRLATDEARKAIDAYNVAQKQEEQQTTLARLNTLKMAEADLAAARAKQAKTKALLAGISAESSDPNDPLQAQNRGAAERYRSQIDAQDADIARLQKTIDNLNAEIGTTIGKAAADPLARIELHYNNLIDAAKLRLKAEHATKEEVAAQTALYNTQKEAALDAERARQSAAKRAKTDTSNYEVGRVVDVAGATKIIESIGGRVTSGYRSTEKQAQLFADKLAGRHDGPVAVPGTSAHERGQAIDVAFGDGISIASIKKAFAEAGVALRQVLREPGQGVYHVEFGPKGKSAEQVAADRERERVKAIEIQKGYDEQLRRATDDNLQAQIALTNGTDDQVNLKLDVIANDKKQLNAAIEAQLAAGKIPGQTKEEQRINADKLKALNSDTASLKQIAVVRDDISRTVRRQLDAEIDELSRADRRLQLDGELANTGKDRRRIALQRLDIEEKGRRAQAQATLDDPNSTDIQRSSATADLADIRGEHDDRVNKIIEETSTGLEAYRKQLEKAVGSTDALNESLENVAVNGLKRFEDVSADAFGKTAARLLGLKGEFGDFAASVISDLARIGIEQALLGAFGGSGGGLFGFLGKIFKGGNVPGHATGMIPGYASGVITGPGTGTSDSILAFMDGMGLIRVSAGESIMTAAATRRYGSVLKAMNDNALPGFADGLVAPLNFVPRIAAPPSTGSLSAAPASRPITFDLRGAVLTADLLAQMQRIANESAGQAIVQAAPSIVDAAASNTVARLRRPSI